MPALRKFLISDEAATAVEYATMLALILLTCIVAIKAVGSSTSGMWAHNKDELDAAGF